MEDFQREHEEWGQIGRCNHPVAIEMYVNGEKMTNHGIWGYPIFRQTRIGDKNWEFFSGKDRELDRPIWIMDQPEGELKQKGIQ